MKVDLYTKTILTMIAVALVWIGVNTTTTVSAGPEIIKVDIAQVDGRSVGRVALPVVIQGK